MSQRPSFEKTRKHVPLFWFYCTAAIEKRKGEKRVKKADIPKKGYLILSNFIEGKEMKKSGILLEIIQEGQSAITMRTLEAVFFSKKLITNNPDIVKYDFYCENNIFLLPRDISSVTCEDIREFLEKPFLPYPEEIIEAHSYEHWKKGFSRDSLKQGEEAL